MSESTRRDECTGRTTLAQILPATPYSFRDKISQLFLQGRGKPSLIIQAPRKSHISYIKDRRSKSEDLSRIAGRSKCVPSSPRIHSDSTVSTNSQGLHSTNRGVRFQVSASYSLGQNTGQNNAQCQRAPTSSRNPFHSDC
jgi:hypothetical protein